jgi:hypothetical protein
LRKQQRQNNDFSEEKSDAREKRRDAGEAFHRSVGASREADWID